MYRILALLLILSVVLLGCSAAPTATPAPTEAPTEAATETVAPTDTVAAIPTEAPTVAPTDTPQPTETPAPITGTVKSTLNVRDQPATRGKLMGVLKKDDVVTLVGRTDDKTWLQINYPLDATTTGWVLSERINTTASIDALASISTASPTAVATSVAVQPTASTPSTVTVQANTPAATSAAGTPAATTAAETPAATSVATVATTVTVKATTPAAASGGTPPGSIIFDSYENGNFNIYRVRADGTGLQPLITGGSDPALSPDGSKIAYRARKDVGGLGIFLATSGGQYISTVTQESAAGYPTWSPDGNNIAFNTLPNGRLSGIIKRIGVGPDNTPTNIGIGVRPAWQPGNGTFVLFDGCGPGGAQCGSILAENAYQGDPNNPTLITTGTSGAWSPNGSEIAFQAQDDKGNTQIWTASADGKNRKQVTTDTGTHGMPIWSSDGQWLFYRTDQGGVGWAIFAIRAGGTDAHKIVDSNVHPDLWVYAKLAIAP